MPASKVRGVIAAMVAGVVGLTGCSKDAATTGPIHDTGTSITSPDGKYTAHFIDGPSQNGVRTLYPVITEGNAEVFRDEYAYSTKQGGVEIMWQPSEQHVLWILSKDVGSFRVGLDGGAWTKTHPDTRPDEITKR